jgi:inhibitor of cysteine peptidase
MVDIKESGGIYQMSEVPEVKLLPPIKAKMGDIVEVNIPSKPSTGYNCLLSEMPSCAFLVDSKYTPDQPIIPGSGGTSTFRFLAANIGEGKIIFHDVKYGNPLDILPPNQMQNRFIIVE